MADILLIHGPNLNLLGTREPDIYGSITLDQINDSAYEQCHRFGATIETLQSNSEAELVNRVQLASTDATRYIVINPAAFTHTSVALRDAIAASAIPFIEVHLSNVHSREPFRKQSFFSDLAEAVICGLGNQGYKVAIDNALQKLGFALS